MVRKATGGVDQLAVEAVVVVEGGVAQDHHNGRGMIDTMVHHQICLPTDLVHQPSQGSASTLDSMLLKTAIWTVRCCTRRDKMY